MEAAAIGGRVIDQLKSDQILIIEEDICCTKNEGYKDIKKKQIMIVTHKLDAEKVNISDLEVEF